MLHRRRPQSRAAGPRRPRRGSGGMGADLRWQPVPRQAVHGWRRRARHLAGAFEIVALTGTLSPDGGHLHLAVADPGAAPSAATWPRAAPCGPPLRSSWPPTTGWCSAASMILPPATTSWWSASATREARDRRRVRAARVHSTRQQPACGGTRQRTGGWIDRFSAETHPEFRPAGATRCQSLLLAGQAILGADLHEWLFLLVTA